MFAAAREIKLWSSWLRPLAYRFVPKLRRVRELRKKALHFVTPVPIARKDPEKKEGCVKPNDLMEYLNDEMGEPHLADYGYQAD